MISPSERHCSVLAPRKSQTGTLVITAIVIQIRWCVELVELVHNTIDDDNIAEELSDLTARDGRIHDKLQTGHAGNSGQDAHTEGGGTERRLPTPTQPNTSLTHPDGPQ